MHTVLKRQDPNPFGVATGENAELTTSSSSETAIATPSSSLQAQESNTSLRASSSSLNPSHTSKNNPVAKTNAEGSTTTKTTASAIPSLDSSTSPFSQSSSSYSSIDSFRTSAADSPSSTSASGAPIVTNRVEQQKHRTAVAGGVVGGLVAFAIIVFAAYMVIRKSRKLRRGAGGGTIQTKEMAKSYWNLEKQEGELSPPGFFPKEYTGLWPETTIRSSPHII